MGLLPRRYALPATRSSSPGELRVVLSAAFTDMVNSAVDWGRHGDREGVYHYRKLIRRARSLIRLARPGMIRTGADQIDAQLRTAHRAASRLRDLDVFAEHLGRAATGLDATSAISRMVAEARARARAEAQELRSTGQMASAVSGLGALPMLLERSVTRMEITHLTEGLRRTHRSARRAYRRALTVNQVDDVHRWRRRHKDLRHQLELLADVGVLPKRYRPRLLVRVARHLGEFTDLIALRDWLGHSPLTEALDERIAEALAQAQRKSASIYAASSRHFVAHVGLGKRPIAVAQQRHSGGQAHSKPTGGAV